MTTNNATMNVKDLALQLGVSEKEIQSYLNKINYRKMYNLRPEVKERRAAYNKVRNDKIKMIGELIKSM